MAMVQGADGTINWKEATKIIGSMWKEQLASNPASLTQFTENADWKKWSAFKKAKAEAAKKKKEANAKAKADKKKASAM